MLFGASGMLGGYVYSVLKRNYEVDCIFRVDFDIVKDCWNRLRNILIEKEYDVIINCAGVIPQKYDQYSYLEYIRVNSIFPHKLYEYSRNKKIIHISTNDVFENGLMNVHEGNNTYDKSIYSVSKLMGENPNVSNIRTSIIGHEMFDRSNFLDGIIFSKKNEIYGYENHMWNGVTCLRLARIIYDIVKHELYWKGVRHINSLETVTKYDLCDIVNEVYALNKQLIKIQSNEYYCKTLSSEYESFFKDKTIKEEVYEQSRYSLIPLGEYKLISSECKLCRNELEEIFSFEMPLAGGFLKNKSDYVNEFIYPITFVYCSQCKTGFVKEIVTSSELFSNVNGNSYFYYSSTIPKLKQHFKDLSKVVSLLPQLKENLLEIGCNDGVFLNNFIENTTLKNIVGIDPSDTIKNIKEERIHTYQTIFDDESVSILEEKYGGFDVIVACNCFAHIDDILSVYKNCKRLLREKGLLIVEVHYFPNIVNGQQFDFIYHEHMMYYSKETFQQIARIVGLRVTKYETIDTHGGSLRAYLQNNFDNMEMNMMNERINIKSFKHDLYVWRLNTLNILNEYRRNGKVMCAYGASGRTNTILNFLNFEFDFILDDSPNKIGCYIPKYHTPIVGTELLYEKNVEYCFILAYPYKQDILRKHKKFLEKGGSFLLLQPDYKNLTLETI